VLGRPNSTPRFLLLLVAAAVVLDAAAVSTAAGPPASGVALALGSNGTVDAGLNFVVANGSAVRYAMDGNFTPLVDLLPESNASKASLLSAISAAESDPITAGLFGDRDGKVDQLDVNRFQSLVVSYSKYLPTTTFTGVLNVTMDGNAPISDQLKGVVFTNAIGPDNSSAPLGVTATLAVPFAWSGVAHSHTFVVTWNLPSVFANLSVPVAPINVSFVTPTAITITSVTGLNESQVSNDPFGWGAASASGQYTPFPGHSIVIQFGPSFPTGDALILAAIVVVAGVGVGLVLLRRRRGRRQKSMGLPPGPASEPGSGVGPSSGSG
jgi:hypothetical protein